MNIPYIAITAGGEAIEYLSAGDFGKLEVPQIEAVDTLGAGDIFHGAFCHSILEEENEQENFVAALESAAKVASFSCKFFGTREWMKSF